MSLAIQSYNEQCWYFINCIVQQTEMDGYSSTGLRMQCSLQIPRNDRMAEDGPEEYNVIDEDPWMKNYY